MSPTLTTHTCATASSVTPAPQLPDDLAEVLKRVRMPYLRAVAPEVLATARAQRWDPTELLRVLLTEEVRGRDEATKAARRKGRRTAGRQDLRLLAGS